MKRRKFNFWSYVEGMERGSKEIMKLVEEDSSPQCKFCGSPRVVKNGTFRGTQNWLCRNCGRGFVDNKALPKMKHSIEQIASAMACHYGGMSLNGIRMHLEQQYGYSPSDSAIYTWVTRFSKRAINEAKRHTPRVGNVWIADETVLRMGGAKLWLWDIIDSDTRFLLATHLSPTRTTRDARILMGLASNKAGKAPKVVITDKLQAYLDGIELTFGADTKHIQSQPFTDEDSTNVIERFQGTLKDRTKVMRGFKSIKSARLILDGWLVHYNFFRPHESLSDKTPAEKAGIKFPFKNWLDVVKSSKPRIISISPVSRIRRIYRMKPRKSRKVRRAEHIELKLTTVRGTRG